MIESDENNKYSKVVNPDNSEINLFDIYNNLITNNLLKALSVFKKKVSFKVNYFKSPINSGAIARNLGATKAKGDLVAFLDSDVVLDKDYYEKLIRYFVDENNRIIYKTIKNLLEKNILVSPITLKNYLPDNENNIDNIKYLNQIKGSQLFVIGNLILKKYVILNLNHFYQSHK